MYEISFLAAQGPGALQPVSVSVDGTSLGIYAPSDDFSSVTTSEFTATTGSHTVAFAATDPTTTGTTLIDLVTVSEQELFWLALQEHHPALVILDVDMPGVNGLELCRVLRSEVLVLASRDYVAAARLLGFSHWRAITREVLPGTVPLLLAMPSERFSSSTLPSSPVGL